MNQRTTNNVLVDLLTQYCELVPEDKIYKVGEVFNYYHADDLNSKILTRKLIKVDIKSAFPTICELLFGSESPFIQKLKAIEDKLERNIFLSNTLKNITDRNYLLELKNYSKIVVFSYIFNNYENVTVFEYQKDGVLFSGDKIHTKNKELGNILNSTFVFHIDSVDVYIRFGKTSYYCTNNEIEVKGTLKNPPLYVADKIKEIIKDPYIDLTELSEIYTEKRFLIYKSLNLIPELTKYFKFNDLYYLDKYGVKKTNPIECYPRSILKYCLFPILSMMRTE